MTIYGCLVCNKEFRQKCHLDNHLYKKKKPCIKKNVILETKTNNDNNDNNDNINNDNNDNNDNINNDNINNDNINYEEQLKNKNIENEKLNIEIEKLNNLVIALHKNNDFLLNLVSSSFNLNDIKKQDNNKTTRKSIPQTLRFAVWNKYFEKKTEDKCLCCKYMPLYITNFDCGHIISHKHGGTIHIDNLKPICRTCNLSMGAMNMNDFISKYGFDNINTTLHKTNENNYNSEAIKDIKGIKDIKDIEDNENNKNNENNDNINDNIIDKINDNVINNNNDNSNNNNDDVLIINTNNVININNVINTKEYNGNSIGTDKKLTCVYCQMLFTRKDNLTKHERERCKQKKLLILQGKPLLKNKK
jgi:hypothetical protein